MSVVVVVVGSVVVVVGVVVEVVVVELDDVEVDELVVEVVVLAFAQSTSEVLSTVMAPALRFALRALLTLGGSSPTTPRSAVAWTAVSVQSPLEVAMSTRSSAALSASDCACVSIPVVVDPQPVAIAATTVTAIRISGVRSLRIGGMLDAQPEPVRK